MGKIIKTTPGKTYVVEDSNGCDVINTATLAVALTVEDGKQGYFVATAQEYEVGETATVVEVFKCAPWQRLALMGVLGGNAGGSGLPAGYKRVEWLENPYSYSQSSFLFAYFALGSITRTADDSIKVETEHRLTEIPGQNNNISTSEGLNCDKGTVALSQKSFARLANVDPNAGTNTAIYNFAGQYDHARNGYDYHLCDTSRTWDTAWHKQSIYVDAYTAIYKEDDYVEEHPIVYAPVNFEPSSPVFCFGSAKTGDYYPASSRFGQKKSFKVWKNDELVWDLIPALDETGAPCMFDKVSKTAFYNAGTGDFIYPTASTTYSLRRVLPDWGKLTEHGLRRLYHAPADYEGELYDYALENGYKPIIEPERPEEGYWIPQWRETEDEIILDWVETEEPKDEFLTPNEHEQN